MHATVDSMAALLNEILDISRLDAGTVAPRTASFAMQSVLDRLRAAYMLPATRKGLLLRVRACDAIVETDPVLLYRVLANLTENALRYTREGGVLIGCRSRGDGLWVEVWDTGVGIPEDQFEAIFQEFRQLSNPQRDRELGFGLGLAIVERTARLLDLPLRLASRVGHGSVFRLRLPHGDPAHVRAPDAPRSTDALEGCRVVVVEDDAPIRAGLLLLLEGWGCDARAVSHGSDLDALLDAMPLPPEAFVVDYRMPGEETGIDVLLRMRERFPEAFGILVSGDVSPQVLRAAREAHVELLHKPLKPARLRALLGSARTGRDVPMEAAAREAEQA
jgi:CheY-like chemotaxis protein/two-component sensor histidine kinase